jgi:ATP-binding protein involved in chromosome partitioning
MFKQLGVPLLGIVENMSIFIPPDDPKKKYAIFGEGGGRILAEENNFLKHQLIINKLILN